MHCIHHLVDGAAPYFSTGSFVHGSRRIAAEFRQYLDELRSIARIGSVPSLDRPPFEMNACNRNTKSGFRNDGCFRSIYRYKCRVGLAEWLRIFTRCQVPVRWWRLQHRERGHFIETNEVFLSSACAICGPPPSLHE